MKLTLRTQVSLFAVTLLAAFASFAGGAGGTGGGDRLLRIHRAFEANCVQPFPQGDQAANGASAHCFYLANEIYKSNNVCERTLEATEAAAHLCRSRGGQPQWSTRRQTEGFFKCDCR